jgi:dipeptidyl aminopeptidase/acylaminoacyl peptidase
MVKAKSHQAWIVLRGNAKNSYNFYFSRDLKKYVPLSNIHPERSYNWLVSELHTIKLPGGDSTQGVLYKPDNFNPHKKYPVIIYYYEDLSNDINKFQDPQQVGAVINIPHFVSNGCLVLTPDIVFRTKNIGESALSTVESCAKYLANLSFIDAQKIGINGHSFGGYETNYIVTHSKIFAAALSGAGTVNTISSFGTVKMAGSNSTGFTDDPIYYGVDKPYWENLTQHIDASPIFSVQYITTPLLLFHNRDDGAVPFEQGIEFFIALRRLGKKVWLLQYDNEDHGIYNSKKAQFDLETRYMQFFDHYLKDKPAPVWMTRGIPAKLKGIDDGLSLDTEIKTPGEGLNIQK